ncbi:hypothetical protein QGN23_00495 [Chryseobacterium gotjawalense]|uniref:Uncharacterized protein n=1 Tax=Chryseobacterium gotjawalense TaxID=3042315 RepID=A0ABY8RGR8_9FLAO|nr:hypothetical protein [Chryseobacterium sp. wdc7]WHF53180.1 hypothetical protein QGN23_00495 [Chryseobacterium sp. wdc7]
MLLGIAWGNHNGNTTYYKNSNNVGIQTSTHTEGLDPGTETDGGDGTGGPHGPIGGNTGQTPPTP